MTTSIFQASLEKIYGKLTICPSEHNVDDMAYFLECIVYDKYGPGDRIFHMKSILDAIKVMQI